MLVKKMCELQKHGGPDDEGIYINEEEKVVLGNRRLSIMDLSHAGHMPMVLKNRYYITYNGEIYNFKELRSELIELGHKFSTETDTEVILASFSQWGVQSFSRFKGMFAFALWDDYSKDIFLVRDPGGIKPLYYHSGEWGIHFASEIRAFEPLSDRLNNASHWPILLMAFGHLPEPTTTLSQIKPLPKGCFLKYSASHHKLSLQTFSHYSFNARINTETGAAKNIRDALAVSIDRHLLSDAPIGIFLSGGVDSGLLSILASRNQSENINCLSLYFDDPAFSEKKYQDIIVDKIKSTHHQYLLQEQEFNESLPKVLDDMDMPSCDGINTWFISRCAKQNGLKAVLSGIGADELLGGYPSFNRMQIALLMQKMPGLFINAGRKSTIKKFSRLSYLNLEGIKGAYLFLRGYFTPHEIAKQLDCTETEVWNLLNEIPVLQDIGDLHHKDQASWMEINLYMQNQLLRDADVMGMAHGVEIRVPFMDEGFVRSCLSVSPYVKYRGEVPKPLLVNSFKAELPESIWNRKKMGFSFPFTEWLKKSVYIKGLMENSDASTQANYKLFLNGKLHWSQLMCLVLIKNRGVA